MYYRRDPFMMRTLLQVSIAILCLLTGFVFTFKCPENQYPYSCASCLRIEDTESNFNAALEMCRSSGGNLLPVENDAQFSALKWYLSSLNDDRRLWIGYKFNSSAGVVVDAEGLKAPDVVQPAGDNYVGGDVTGDENTCIGIQGEKFFTSSCSDSLVFLCSYNYQVPQVRGQVEGIVYARDMASLVLEVQFEGLGVTGLEWRHNGMELGPGVGIETMVNSGFTEARLALQEFQSNSHSGRYEVLVESPAGRAVLATWEVQPEVLGSFTINPQNLTVPPGQIATFECEAGEARPKALIKWYKDSTLLDVHGERFYVSDASGTLFIRELEESDGGAYHCEASNGAGSMSSVTAQLSVMENEPQSTFFLHPRNATVLVGDTYSVECVGKQSITSMSRYLIYKSKNLDSLLETFSYPNESGFPFYRIENVTMEDGEDYLCQFGPIPISPEYRLPFSRSGLLTVHTKPHIDWISVNGAESGLHSVPHGTRLTLRCMVGGVPSPDMVVWSVDGRTISETSVEGGIAVLEINEFSEPGIYQCQTSNVYGSDVIGVVLCAPDGVPGVVPFHAVSDSNTSLYVNWTAPYNPNIHLLQYEVVYTNLGLGIVQTSGLLPANYTEFIISGLNSSTEYEVYVVAHSHAGMGAQTVTTTVSTFCNAPDNPIPVSAITLIRSEDNTVLHISWPRTSVPANQLVHYEVQYRDANRSIVNNVILGREINRTTIAGLSRAGDYEVRIRISVQIQRDPRLFDHTPWSQWQFVMGIATLSPSPQPPTVVIAPVGTEEEDFGHRGLLLVVIIGPIAVVAIVSVVLAMVIVAVCWWYKHRPEGSYRPRDEEEKLSGRRIPMGDQIFSIPIGNRVMDRPITHAPLQGTLDDSQDAGSKDYLVTSSFPSTSDPDA